MHPNGQLPAYEFALGDVNPPVHAWACWRVYKMTGPAREARPGLPGARLPQAAAQLHLVGEPQGRRRPQPLRRRLPGPRQHRRLRPLPAAADGRAPGAGRRHRLDGLLLRHHAVDGPGAGQRRPRLRGHGVQVLRALRGHRRRHEPLRRQRPLGRAGRLLLRRAPHGPRPRGPAARAIAGGPGTALRRRDPRGRRDRAPARLQEADGLVPEEPHGPRTPHHLLREGMRPRPPRAVAPGRFPRASGSSGCSSTCSTRRSSSRPAGSARSRGSTRTSRTSSTPTAGSTASTTCPPSRTPGSSAATPTGAGPSGSR